MFLLRIILFFIIISIILRIFGRILLLFIRTRKSFNINENQEYRGRKEGEVSVQSNNLNKKIINKDLGEYVNYEEIDK
jgi:uncharacterized protein YpmS